MKRMRTEIFDRDGRKTKNEYVPIIEDTSVNPVSVSIAYITCRKQCQFKWFFDGLKNQVAKNPKHKFQLIVVDYWKDERTFDFSNDVGIEVLHITPLPSVWQGKYQKSKHTWYAAANARNTGFVYAKYDTIAFIDDLTAIGGKWLEGVIDASQNNYIALGAYQKHWDMVVENGVLVDSRMLENGNDSRWDIADDDGKAQVMGNLFYGCSSCMPLSAALEINGFDLLTDAIGYEDTLFGIRLQKKGNIFYYDKRMFTVESENHVATDVIMKREEIIVSVENYFRILKNFGISQSIYPADANKDASHILVELASQSNPKSLWNFFDLRELRNKVQSGIEITFEDMHYPERWWFDDAPISEM